MLPSLEVQKLSWPPRQAVAADTSPARDTAAPDVAAGERREMPVERVVAYVFPLLASMLFHLAIVLAVFWLAPAWRTDVEPSPITVSLTFVESPTPEAEPSSATASPVEPFEPPTAPPDSVVERTPTEPPARQAMPRPRPAAKARTKSSPAAVPKQSLPEAEQNGPSTVAAAPPAAALSPLTREVVAVEKPAPLYPAAARRQHIEGDVLLRVEVDERGNLASLSILRGSGFSSLDEAATAAVRRWRFEPAVQQGRAVTAVADIPIHFRLVE